jgi:diguanylate cyclase (GGDEF)-like protein
MLHSIYGLTQNYSKTQFELCTHLSEVTGAFGKYLFKLRRVDKAREFLPKMFAWAVALLMNMKGEKANLEELLLTKYPRVCPYCRVCPCACFKTAKPKLEPEKVRDLYLRDSTKQARSLGDFQLMFRKIYEVSWNVAQQEVGSEAATWALRKIYIRMIEEVSEIAESVRFYHLYPSNFDNELADYLAWWFAMVSSLHSAAPEHSAEISAEDLLWSAYPGLCVNCTLPRCDCRPGPVRELLSKPSLNEREFFDGLTQAQNKAAFERDLTQIEALEYPMPTPVACVWLDLDDFKQVNEIYDHSAGDEALKHLVNTVLQKIRTRDRCYRVGGMNLRLCAQISPRRKRKGSFFESQMLSKSIPYSSNLRRARRVRV